MKMQYVSMKLPHSLLSPQIDLGNGAIYNKNELCLFWEERNGGELYKITIFSTDNNFIQSNFYFKKTPHYCLFNFEKFPVTKLKLKTTCMKVTNTVKLKIRSVISCNMPDQHLIHKLQTFSAHYLLIGGNLVHNCFLNIGSC